MATTMALASRSAECETSLRSERAMTTLLHRGFTNARGSRRRERFLRPVATGEPSPERPVPQPPEGEREARVDEKHAAKTADAGDDLSRDAAELAGVRKS